MSDFVLPRQIDNQDLAAEGLNSVVTTGGQVAGASFARSWDQNPFSRLTRRLTADAQVQTAEGEDPETGGANIVTMSAEEANARYGVQGRLTFDQPTPEPVARSMRDYHVAQAERESVIARSGGGVGSGAVARVGMAFTAAMLDPLNIATAVIPFIGEARVAAVLGGAAYGARGAAMVRVVEGAGSGFIGAAALEPLNYMLSRQERDDYTMGDVATNLAFGTLLGAILHPAVGALRDARAGAPPPWSPEAREAAMRQAAAAMAEGRPIAAADAIQWQAAREGRSTLMQWYDTQLKLNEQMDQAVALRGEADTGLTAARERLLTLQDEAASMRAEVQDAADRARAYHLSPGERRRLAEYERVVADPDATLPQRLAAEIARMDLLDTSPQAPRPYAELDAARTEQERLGLSRRLEAIEAEAGKQEAVVAAQEARLEALARNQDAAILAMGARRELAQSLGEATLEKMAGRMGRTLEPGEAAAWSRAIMEADRANAPKVVESVLAALQAKPRSVVSDLIAEGALSRGDKIARTAMEALTRAEAQAEVGLVRSLRNEPGAQQQAAVRALDATAARAPKVGGEGAAADQIAALEKTIGDIEAELRLTDKVIADEAKAAGRQPPQPSAARIAADEAGKEGERMAKAFEAAATCMIVRM